MAQKIKVIIFGATGMVGEGVLLEALKNPDIDSILVIGRRPCNIFHQKIKEIIHDNFFDYSAIITQLYGYNACFFCLGVSSVGMNEKDYARITYDLTLQAAKVLSEKNPDMIFCYISGAGTDSTENSRIMWARVKGKTENHLTRLPFKAVYLFRPALIRPARGQKNIKPFLKTLGLLYPIIKILIPKYACTMEELGIAMIRAASAGYSKQIIENSDIKILNKESGDEK